MPATCAYDYAVVRVVPSVDRGEFINVGVIVFCRTNRFLAAKIELDPQRLLTLAPGVNVADIQAQLDLIPRLCAGEGAIGQLGQAETFHWLVSPHSTVVQCSPVHSGITDDLPEVVERLMTAMVRRPQ